MFFISFAFWVYFPSTFLFFVSISLPLPLAFDFKLAILKCIVIVDKREVLQKLFRVII